MEKKKGMKNIFKKLHIGSSSINHDLNRPSNDTSSSSSPSQSTGQTIPAVVLPSLPVNRQQDYYSSEEEYQVQLALALSVSNSVSGVNGGGYSESDHIRAVKILSLGQHNTNTNTDSHSGVAVVDNTTSHHHDVAAYVKLLEDVFHSFFLLH
jgi:hypothetical protein